MPKFSDIPQFTRSAGYVVNVSWSYLEHHLTHLHRPGMGSPLILDPDFQRAHVWNDEKRIRYVEFILRGGQSSRDVYLNCSTWMTTYKTPLVLVDGKQRIEAVRRFMNNQVPAFGHLYKEYEDKLKITGPDFMFHVNNLKTRREVLQWYLDINSGGVIHTEKELAKVKRLLELEP